MKKKERIISKIKRIVEEWGNFSTADVECESSPVIASIGKDTHQLCENVYTDGVNATTYVHDRNVNEEFIFYEDLKIDVLEDILAIAENYAVDMQKSMERCKD